MIHRARAGFWQGRCATLALLLQCTTAASAQQQSNSGSVDDPSARVFQLVLPSEHLLGTWGGFGPRLEAWGITPRLTLVTDVAGNAIGGRSRGLTKPTKVEFSLILDLDTIARVKGGSIFVSMAHRWGRSLSATYIGNVFGTQQIFGNPTFRVIDISYQQKLSDGRVELHLGRFATQSRGRLADKYKRPRSRRIADVPFRGPCEMTSDHSARILVSGSTRIARDAGTRHAAPTTPSSPIVTEA
ncbi:MAG TPA: carbohydrate porin [Gemmatimonadaceae bacterium]